MQGSGSTGEYLVISRGQWDRTATTEQIQQAIDEFYDWIEGHIAAGRMRPGQRLANAGKTVARTPVVDGPYGEAKEVIGGFWFIIADSLEQAAELAAGNPCLKRGLYYEIRPIEDRRADASTPMTETPRDDD